MEKRKSNYKNKKRKETILKKKSVSYIIAFLGFNFADDLKD